VEADVVAGCEPFAATGGDDGVLVLHGFTGSPFSMRPLAEVLANRGYSVELPRLPGHGTTPEDLAATRWEDWSGAAAASLDALAARCRRVAVVGLSMGGGLAVWLAEHRPDVVALVVVNPLVVPIADELRDGARQLLDGGVASIDGVVDDIAKPGVTERGYATLPLVAALSLMEGLDGVAADLSSVTCPVLVLTSREDHVVVAENSTRLVEGVSGPVEQLFLERSYHVATLDHDADVVEAETCRFLDAAFVAE
jgi:carboxylesterase